MSQNLFLYNCTQNQFTIQVYTKPVYCTSVHKTSLLVKNERNVHGQNITKECTWTEHYKGTSVTKLVSLQLYTKPVYCTSVHKTSLLVNNERNVHGQNITVQYSTAQLVLYTFVQ